MVYFCADDYGISKESNNRIENCIKNGVLNKVSVLPNGEISDFKQHLLGDNVKLSLHLNLIEGHPLSDPNEINLLVSDDGSFKYSFIGLFFLSLFGKRKELKTQLYTEIKKQLLFWKNQFDDGTTLLVDSHQHIHMIPLVFKTLLQVIEDEGLNVEYLRIPAEPITPYLLTPSLYFSYKPVGIIKQWLLKFLNFVNRNDFKKSEIRSAYFLGLMFSGELTEEKIKKLLVRYSCLAEKHDKDIEITLHPGYLKNNESLISGCRASFKKFYFSPWRKIEYDTLINFNF